VTRRPAFVLQTVTERLSRAVARFNATAGPQTLPHSEALSLAGSATLNAQVWLSQFPWRPTAGWAAIAGLLSAGLLGGSLDPVWTEVALTLLLVDLLWGGIWRLAAGRAEMLPLHEHALRRQVWLPYLEDHSPAALLLGWDDRGVLHLLYRVALPTVALALAVALVLGPAAIWLTLAVIAITVIGWTTRHAANVLPALLHSVITIVLPWTLVLVHFGLGEPPSAGGAPGEAWAASNWQPHGVLVLLWFIHNWGEGRILRNPADWPGIGLLAVADMGIMLLLIALRLPLWLALMAVLWLPTWLSLAQRRPLLRISIWWLLAMLASAAALGQSLQFQS